MFTKSSIKNGIQRLFICSFIFSIDTYIFGLTREVDLTSMRTIWRMRRIDRVPGSDRALTHSEW